MSYLRPGGQAVKTPPFHGGNTGSIPVRVTTFFLSRSYGGVAQPVEHLLHTQGVTDSSSVVSTKTTQVFDLGGFLYCIPSRILLK